MKINVKNVNPTKLHDELIKEGVIPLLVESTPYTEEDKNAIRPDTWITVDNGQVETAQGIIDAFVVTQ